MFWNLIILIGAFLLQLVLSPKPQNAKPQSLDDFNAPTATEGREIPVLFGMAWIAGPNVVWYGDLFIKAIKGARRYGLFGPKQTIGYRYSLGMHMALCHGTADALYQIRVGDKKVWEGSQTTGTLTIDKDDIFGGNEREGGISGDVDFLPGSTSQARNAYLQTALGETDIPAFRGVCSVVLNQVYLGTSAYIKPWAFLLQRINKTSSGAEQWYVEKAPIGSVSVDTDTAIYFALDVSFSMVGSGRLTVMKHALEDLITDMRLGGVRGVDIRMVAWASSEVDSIERFDCDAQDFNELYAWVQGLGSGSDTNFEMAVASAPTFFAASSKSERIVIFLTDGEPNEGSVSAAADTLFGIDNVKSYAFNIDLTNTTYTEQMDNTPSDGVPIVSGSDSSALKVSISSVFSGAYDMNPAHIIRECLTDGEWGMGYTSADIDDDSFTAAADTLYDEGFGLSLLWNREETIENFVSTVLAHIDAYLYVSRSTGKFVLKLIRNDYDTGSLPIIGEDDTIDWPEIARRQPNEAVTSVYVRYFLRSRRKEAAVAVHNIAQFHQTGRMVSNVRQYPGIQIRRLAARVAARDVRSLGAGFASGRIIVKRSSDVNGLNPGDPFRLTSSRHGFSGEVMRVVEMKFGDGRDNRVTITFTQDVFDLRDDLLVDDDPPETGQPGDETPQAVSPRLVEEAPYAVLVDLVGGTDATALLAVDPDGGILNIAGGNTQGQAINAVVEVDGVDKDTLDFCPFGYLDANITETTTAIALTGFDENILEEFSTGGLAVIGTEIVRVDTVDPVTGDLVIARACLDSLPATHTLGDAVILFDGFNVSDGDSYTDGDTPDVQLRTLTGTGELTNPPTDTVTFDSRAVRPLRPANVKVNTVGYSTVDATLAPSVEVTWVNRNRLTQIGGSIQAWTEGTASAESGQTTEIDMYADDGVTLLQTYTSVTSPYTVPAIDYAGEDFIRLKVYAKRDGYRSRNAHEIRVQVAVTNNLLLQTGSALLKQDGDNLRLE